jgi:hypothetical protein
VNGCVGALRGVSERATRRENGITRGQTSERANRLARDRAKRRTGDCGASVRGTGQVGERLEVFRFVSERANRKANKNLIYPNLS